MHLKYLLVILLISLFLIKQVIIANTSEPALDKLIYDYKQAHSQKNIDAVLALYYWDGVDEKIKKSVFNNHKRYLDYKITSIRVAKAPLQEYNPFILEGKKYRTNLKVTKVLKVKFENTKTTKEVTIPIGIKDSKYYFVTARPDK